MTRPSRVLDHLGPKSAQGCQPQGSHPLRILSGFPEIPQGAARKAHSLSPLLPGAAAGIAWDGSGNGLHAVQRFRDAQPRFLGAGSSAVFRFDGVRQHFQVTNVRRKLTGFTVFIVAAAHSNPGAFRAFFAGNEAGRRDYTTGFTIDQGAFP